MHAEGTLSLRYLPLGSSELYLQIGHDNSQLLQLHPEHTELKELNEHRHNGSSSFI